MTVKHGVGCCLMWGEIRRRVGTCTRASHSQVRHDREMKLFPGLMLVWTCFRHVQYQLILWNVFVTAYARHTQGVLSSGVLTLFGSKKEYFPRTLIILTPMQNNDQVHQRNYLIFFRLLNVIIDISCIQNY